MNRKNKTKVDPEIMRELLEQPGVKENAEKMTPNELAWFKHLLVSQGIYARFVEERKSKYGAGS